MQLFQAFALTAAVTLSAAPLNGQSDLDDVEMAHVAVTASDIDIGYAHLALALSETPAVRVFAETMIRDHTAVNGQVAALAERLGIQARDNPMSRELLADSKRTRDEMARLRGADSTASTRRTSCATTGR